MRAVLVRSLLVIAAGAVVLAAVLYVASTVDGRPPEVLEVRLTQPQADDPEVALVTTSIEVSFSEPIEVEGVARPVTLDPAVEGTTSLSGSTLIFTPGEPLALDTAYTVTVDPAIRDAAGNALSDAPDPFRFTTSGRPMLAGSDPADGTDDVAVDAPISLVFSGLMDTRSVESAISVSPPFPFEVRWAGERLELTPRLGLEPATDYTVRVGEDATDIAGVPLADAVAVTFRTVSPGLSVEQRVPAGGSDGIAPRTPIAVVFDRPMDPDSVDLSQVVVEPAVAGSVELVPLPGEDDARLLRLVPSAPLPANTTFEVTLGPDLRAADGGGLAEPTSWTFTTGAPPATLSNRVVFLSDRGGVANVWSMNPDGTGQVQVSAELAPVLDYAVAPDGGALVVGDGHGLVFLRPDGSDRRELTDPAHLEFDAAWSPNSSRIAFARADATTGRGLGLWTWEVGSGAASRIELPRALAPDGSPPAGSGDGERLDLRAPRYAPDGGALSFVDRSGAVGIVELPAQRLTLVRAAAVGVPAWDARSSGVLVRVDDGATRPEPFAAPVAPMDETQPADAGVIRRAGPDLEEAWFEGTARRIVVASDGRIGWIDAGGTVHVAAGFGEPGAVPAGLERLVVDELAMGPDPAALLVVTGTADGGGTVQLVDLERGERTRLVRDGWRVRWVP